MQFAGETLPKIRSDGVGLLFLTSVFQMPLINRAVLHGGQIHTSPPSVNNRIITITTGWVISWAAARLHLCPTSSGQCAGLGVAGHVPLSSAPESSKHMVYLLPTGFGAGGGVAATQMSLAGNKVQPDHAGVGGGFQEEQIALTNQPHQWIHYQLTLYRADTRHYLRR